MKCPGYNKECGREKLPQFKLCSFCAGVKRLDEASKAIKEKEFWLDKHALAKDVN